jgi:para-nitrobenzyl esterase
VEPWRGIKNAKSFGAACPQQSRYGITEASEQEDCLSLNVSVPQQKAGEPKKLRPVFVWLHGGAFVGGSSNLYRLDKLTREGDVVVVSINYRIGVLGFMPHTAFEASTNGGYGLLDQREALRWVQRNIEKFGGDVNNVTIAGESAGAGSVCMHLAAPEKVQGLFHKAIVMSASCLQPMRMVEEAAKSVGEKVASDVGCPMATDTLDCLRRVPVSMLLKAQSKATQNDPLAFAPVVGNQVVPRQAAESGRTGQYAKVPMLMGGTRRELLIYVAYAEQAGNRVTPDNYQAYLNGVYGRTTDEKDRQVPQQVAQSYPLGGKDPAPVVLGQATTDFTPEIGINACLLLTTGQELAASQPVYMFEFADDDALVSGVSIPAQPALSFKLGAVHSSELNYLFPGMSNNSKINAPALPRASQALATTMVAYWTSFARDGQPKAAKSADWPLYTSPTSVMQLKPQAVKTFDASKLHKCDFWKRMYPKNF